MTIASGWDRREMLIWVIFVSPNLVHYKNTSYSTNVEAKATCEAWFCFRRTNLKHSCLILGTYAAYTEFELAIF